MGASKALWPPGVPKIAVEPGLETLPQRLTVIFGALGARGPSRRLFFANRGVFRSGDYAEIMNKVSALSVLSNAVLVWNTVRIGAILDELANADHTVRTDALARVSPLLDTHVIATGSYHFNRAIRSAQTRGTAKIEVETFMEHW